MASQKTNYFWKKLAGYYGSRLQDTYGETPPSDWADLINRRSKAEIDEALSKIRRECPNFPPTFPQVEKAFQKPVHAGNKRSPAELLCEMLLDSGAVSATEATRPWTWVMDKYEGVITGVLVPGDSGTNKRYMISDYVTSEVVC